MDNMYRRDPILQVGVQTAQQKPLKTAVPSYMKITNWLENKPKGIGRGQFFGQSEGSFRVGKEELSAYRPTKKVFPVTPPYSFEKPEGCKKIVVQAGRDPILNPDTQFSSNGKKVRNTAFKASTLDDSYKPQSNGGKQDFYLKRNSSSVFRGENDSTLNNCQRKQISERPSSTADLLRYSFALPYRDENVTRKIV